jgi:hypothetical protein
MVCWDERWNYMAFEFLRDGKTMARGHSKGAIVGGKGIVTSTDARNAMGLDTVSPPFPASISRWVDAEQLLSV